MFIELRGFGWRYAGRKAWAVRDVDLRIEAGERVLLLGASGAGKSTVLAALAGLLTEDSGEQAGEVLVDGHPANERRTPTGVLFQDPQTALVLAKAGDDVAFGLENLAVPAGEIWPRVDEALAAVGFGYPRDRRTDALSGGEQQRLALAGALASRPRLLLLDEPTANLDPAGAALVRESIRLATGSADTLPSPRGGSATLAHDTLVLVEHRVADALPLVDRAVVLGPHGVIADGTPARVFAEHGEALAADGVWVPGVAPLPPRLGGAPGAELLHAEGLRYRHPRSAVAVLQDVDLTVAEGAALAVLGPNGAGKSTLALLLGGLLRPTGGVVTATERLAGADAAVPPWRWRAAALAGRIGSVFQNPEHQFVTGRVRDEIALGGRPPAVVADLLTRLRLDHLAAANPFTLSGGEARRLSVATALAASPGVLVLDEPTFGQDLRTWRELVELIADQRDAGRGIVLVTHDQDLVDTVADRIVALDGVRI